MGLPQDEVEKASRGFPVGHYVFLYQPIPEGVEIIHVLDGARDMDAVFPPDDQPMSTVSHANSTNCQACPRQYSHSVRRLPWPDPNAKEY